MKKEKLRHPTRTIFHDGREPDKVKDGTKTVDNTQETLDACAVIANMLGKVLTNKE